MVIKLGGNTHEALNSIPTTSKKEKVHISYALQNRTARILVKEDKIPFVGSSNNNLKIDLYLSFWLKKKKNKPIFL